MYILSIYVLSHSTSKYVHVYVRMYVRTYICTYVIMCKLCSCDYVLDQLVFLWNSCVTWNVQYCTALLRPVHVRMQ